MPITATTTLPDATLGMLDASVEDQLTATWADVINYGSYRLEYRETGASSWIDDGTEPETDTSHPITGLEDGEQYDVRLRTETEHVIGAWSSLTAITVLPAPSNLAVAIQSDGREASLTWDDNADNEDGQRVQRQQPDATPWATVTDVGPNTESYLDSIIPANDYDYRIETYTEHVVAQSGTVSVSGTRGSPRVTASGWSVSVTHPVSGRVIRPDAINPEQIQYIPGPNTMPRIRMPVRRAPSWLEEGFDDNPDMTVHLDGDQLPIDGLVDVEQQEGQTILVGEGGAELRTTVEVEYDSAERPTAATDLIDTHTTYASVDNTPTQSSQTSTVQSPSGESALGNVIAPDADVPLVFAGGGLKPAQTGWTLDDDEFVSSSGAQFTNEDGYNNGTYTFFDSEGSFSDFTITTQYDIDKQDFGAWIRGISPGADDVVFRAFLDPNGSNEQIGGGTLTDTMQWVFFGTLGGSGTVSAGTHTIRFEVSTIEGTADAELDIVRIEDTTYSYNYDNTLSSPQGWLDSPELYPPSVDAEFDPYESAFSVVGGEATATLTDTGGAQALALSNDRGQTYPISASNTTSVSGSFGSAGATLNLKATLARYSPSGTRDETPRLGYDAQRIDGYTLDVDEVFESLLIDESFDNSLDSILNQILGDQFAWTISNESGTTTFTVDEPGNTTADRDPEISEATVEKKVQTYQTVTIKGSNRPVSAETFTANTGSFVDLAEDDIVTGSEAVYDSSGTQFTRGVDYVMDYQNGRIKALLSEGLSDSTDYSIDYRHQISASHTVPTATGDTLTRTIPGVVSDRQAEQIAYVLAEVYPGVATPRYEGRIVVPRLDVTFDPLEGLALEDLDLPDVATPLSIRGEPEVTPLGLTLDLGSAPRLEESLSNIRDQVSAVSDRV